MVASKESFSSLDLTDGPSIHMVDDSHIPYVGKGTIQFEHGVFNNVLYVPFLAANLLYVYQMTHNGSTKRFVFGHDTVKISNISSRKMIAKGVTNHASNAYAFSHFFPYSHQSSLLTHANETRRIWNERFDHLNFKYCTSYTMKKWLKDFP